jgi:hypothetical protein
MAEDGPTWRDLVLDKGIDVILVPLGLFAALWLQDCVDARKDHDDYIDQLERFRDEIKANREKTKELAKQIGPFDDPKTTDVLGPFGPQIEKANRVVEISVESAECLVTIASPTVDAKGITTCQQVLEKNEKDPATEFVFATVELSPLYRYEVWQMYLQHGIQKFESDNAKSLGLQLAELYASAHESEKRVAELEEAYNLNLDRRHGTLVAAQTEVQHVTQSNRKPEEMGGRLAEIAADLRKERAQSTIFAESFRIRMERLKAYVSAMDARFQKVDAALAAEIGD